MFIEFGEIMFASKFSFRFDGEKFNAAANYIGVWNNLIMERVQLCKHIQPTQVQEQTTFYLWNKELEHFENNLYCLHIDAIYIQNLSVLAGKAIRTQENLFSQHPFGINDIANFWCAGKTVGYNL